MRTFAIETLGCKVNQYESQQIRQYLESLGLSAAAAPAPASPAPASPDASRGGGQEAAGADLVVVNTCCVTRTASAKSRQCIHRVQSHNPSVVTVVCGCLPAVQIGELNGIAGSSIEFVRSRNNLAATLHQIVNDTADISDSRIDTDKRQTCNDTDIKAEIESKIKDKAGFTNLPRLPQLTDFKGHTRAFLKVQGGCDGPCTYCIIPKVRPDVHSKSIEDAISEARAFVQAGHKEIVLTGVCLGAYGRNTVRRKKNENGDNGTLSELLDKMAEVPGLVRIRLSSLEPGDVTDDLLEVFRSHSNIMPHVHLSVQSGSDNVLRKMARQYRADELREKIELIKSRLDRPAITSDIIVGFPAETEGDFEETVELAGWAGFSKMHVFPFSARAGTAAVKMKDRIQPKIIKERAEILRKLSNELGRQFRSQFIGQTVTVLLEDTKPQSGRCERYFKVFLDEARERHKKNELVKVKITGNLEEGAAAEEVKN
jgi:threonylcarbamoyladenosine tRNA methylthiotransferase MtaB